MTVEYPPYELTREMNLILIGGIRINLRKDQGKITTLNINLSHTLQL